MQIEWWRLLLVALIFGGLFATWLWVKKGDLSLKGLVQPPNLKMKVLERQWLTSQTFIFLIEVEGARFLLARTHGGVAWQPLGEAKASPPVANEHK